MQHSGGTRGESGFDHYVQTGIKTRDILPELCPAGLKILTLEALLDLEYGTCFLHLGMLQEGVAE